MIIRESAIHAAPKSWTLPSFSPVCLKINSNTKQIWFELQQKLTPGLLTRERKCFWQQQHVREIIIISCIFSNQGCANATKKRGKSIKAKYCLQANRNNCFEHFALASRPNACTGNGTCLLKISFVFITFPVIYFLLIKYQLIFKESSISLFCCCLPLLLPLGW